MRIGKKLAVKLQKCYMVLSASNEDTRDWQSIMASKDILKEAREQTGKMLNQKWIYSLILMMMVF